MDNFDSLWNSPELDFDPFPKQQPNLDLWRWSFASLPDERMKAVAAGWMVRVLLGEGPAEMSPEEIEILSAVTSLAMGRDNPEIAKLWCDA